MVQTLPLGIWILLSIIPLVWTIIATRLLQRELKKRKSGTAHLTTKSLKLWSYLCMLFAPVAGLASGLLYLPGFCYVMWIIAVAAFNLQLLFMGFFQLSRIYYCFSISRTYVSKGYPNWVFFIMYGIGTMSILCFTIYATINPIGSFRSVCGVNKNGDVFWEFVDFNSAEINSIASIIQLSGLVYYMWDIATLLMYALKIRLFKKYETENPEIYARILCVLHRVLILSLFYEFVFLFLWIIRISLDSISQYVSPSTTWFLYMFHGVKAVANGVHVLSYSFSVYLMLDHNTDEYVKFLNVLRRLKLYYIYCCCRHMVADQLKALNTDEQNVAEIVANNVVEDTAYETHDISSKHAQMAVRPRTVSPTSEM